MPEPVSRSGGSVSPAYDLEAHRRRIPILSTTVPLNNCSQAPQMDTTRQAARDYLESWRRDGMDWDRWLQEVEAARAAFAGLIGASPDEVAVSTSVSAATASIASALDYRGERRRVVATGAEFPTVGQIWLAQERRGADVRWIPLRDGEIRLEDCASAIDDRTLIVSATHAYFQNGSLLDVAAIADLAHDRGAFLFVDAYQTLGVLPIDVRSAGIDFLASGNLKYLMGIPGIAFLYVRRELVDELRPTVTGWFGRLDPFAFRPDRLDWSPEARRFDTGTPPILAAYVARAGMQTISEVGVAAIRDWTGHLSRRLLEGAGERGLELSGPTSWADKTPSTAIVCRDSHAVESRLRGEGILASARGPAVRLAPHFYNTAEEIELALDAVSRVVGETA